MEQKKHESNCTGREGRQLHFVCVIPFPQTSIAQCQEGTSSQFSSRKAKQAEQPALQGERQILQSFQSTTRWSCFSFIPPRPAKLRCIEMAMNEEEKQGLAVAATQWEQAWILPVLQISPAAFSTGEGINCQHGCYRPLSDGTSFLPTGSHVLVLAA